MENSAHAGDRGMNITVSHSYAGRTCLSRKIAIIMCVATPRVHEDIIFTAEEEEECVTVKGLI